MVKPLLRDTPSFDAIAAGYDAFLIDLWGVVHDGSALYPGAGEAIARLYAQGKRILFLSNAPRRAAMAEATLSRLGIPRAHYQGVLTSGEAAFEHLRAQPYGARYVYLGPSKDENVIADLPYRQSEPEEADFILNTGFEYDYQPAGEIEPLLQRLAALKLPLLCINPDLEVVKQDGTRLLCAGWVARRYEALGGQADYIGKPYPLVYDLALATLGVTDKQRLLAIGDNPDTDIAGAKQAGIDSLLITGGILSGQSAGEPDFILPRFA